MKGWWGARDARADPAVRLYDDADRHRQLSRLVDACDILLRAAAGQPELDVSGTTAVRGEAFRMLVSGWSDDELRTIGKLWSASVEELGRPDDEWAPRLNPDTPASSAVHAQQPVIRGLLLDLRSKGSRR